MFHTMIGLLMYLCIYYCGTVKVYFHALDVVFYVTQFAHFFSEKKLLVNSEDCGRDLTSINNLRKKQKRIEAEISSHEPNILRLVVSCLFVKMLLW